MNVDRTSPEHRARVEAHLNHIGRTITRTGYAVQPVFGETATDWFSYTIGLTQRGLPEIAIHRYEPDLGDTLLELVVSATLATAWHEPDSLSPEALADGRTIRVNLPNPQRTPITFAFKTPGGDDAPVIPGMAHEFYRRTVPHVIATTKGWPCPVCALRQNGRCTCAFDCFHKLCRHRTLPLIRTKGRR